MTNQKKLLLIDGSSVAFRAFFALYNQIDRFRNNNGLHTNAIYGFHLMLDNLLERCLLYTSKPDKIVIDAFISEKNYQKYLKNERNHFEFPITLEEKAEGKYLAVAVSSIIARNLFLENLDKLSQEVGYTLPSGAGAKSDQVAAKLQMCIRDRLCEVTDIKVTRIDIW